MTRLPAGGSCDAATNLGLTYILGEGGTGTKTRRESTEAASGSRAASSPFESHADCG